MNPTQIMEPPRLTPTDEALNELSVDDFGLSRGSLEPYDGDELPFVGAPGWPGEIDPPAAGPGADDSVPLDWEMVAMQLARTVRQVVESGDQLVMVACDPEGRTALEAAFRALPSGVLPPTLQSELPFIDGPPAEGVRLITRSDLEIQFLQRHYGPPEGGGNNFVPRLQAELDRANCPLRITPEYLRGRHLDELAEQTQSRIVRPSEGLLVSGMPRHR